VPARQDSSAIPTVALSVVGTLLALVVVAFIAIVTGMMPANADTPPWRLERWAAKRSLHATLAREAPSLKEPLPVSDSSLIEGVRLYGTHCVVCHGAADAKASAIANGLYVRSPQFGKHDVADDPVGVTYWKITHGIRLTGMPAFDSSLTAAERWKIAGFLARQDSLPPGAAAAWKALPSAATSSAITGSVVTVHASDFAFDGPDQVPAGMITFRMVNDGPGLHHMDIVRIDSGKTTADLMRVLAKPGALQGWVVFVGGPNAPDPHSESNATIDLKAGSYALVCFVDVPGGVAGGTDEDCFRWKDCQGSLA
jgi:thiosulfate dehydrogenase